jgi:hypothetical protein
MNHKRIPDEEIIEAYRTDKNCRVVAETLGINYKTVRGRLHANNINIRNGRPIQGDVPRRDYWREYYRKAQDIVF